jgi:pectate lyase
VQARVRARAFNGTNRFAALYARYQGIGNSYYMTLRNNNKIELKKVVNNVIGTPALDEADFAVPLDTWFTMRLEVQGNALRGYVNGELLLEATDTSLASGRGALGTFATSAEFDDVILSRLRP